MATETEIESVPADWSALPGDLPVPVDDGLADHLKLGAPLPTSVLLRATATSSGNGNGETTVDLRALSFEGPVLVFVYPRTGQPGVANPAGWDAIPGARGCTPVSIAAVTAFPWADPDRRQELCAIRDTLGALRGARPGGVRIFALSTQSGAYQSEVARRLGLPYAILSDETGAFWRAMGLPTFEVDGVVLLKRITLLMYEGEVVGRDYPVFPSDQAASASELLVSIFGN
jgi:peroxiredoxin